MTGKQFATLVIITFIVGMIWLISDIIFNTKASIPVNPKLEGLLSPIIPNFNQRVLDEINQEVIDTSLTTPALSDAITQPFPSTAPTSIPFPSPLDSPSPLPSASPSSIPLPSSLLPETSPIATTSGTFNL